MTRRCVRKFRGKDGVMRCASYAGKGRKRKARKGRRGLSGDVAKCVNYAKTKGGLWRCLMQVHGPGSPMNRPKTKKKYSYSTSKARKRRLRKSPLSFKSQTARGVTRRRKKRA
jgi:hypothetical protein